MFPSPSILFCIIVLFIGFKIFFQYTRNSEALLRLFCLSFGTNDFFVLSSHKDSILLRLWSLYQNMLSSLRIKFSLINILFTCLACDFFFSSSEVSYTLTVDFCHSFRIPKQSYLFFA